MKKTIYSTMLFNILMVIILEILPYKYFPQFEIFLVMLVGIYTLFLIILYLRYKEFKEKTANLIMYLVLMIIGIGLDCYIFLIKYMQGWSGTWSGLFT